MDYLRPAALPGLLSALTEWRERAWLLAGGTDLLVKLRQGTVEPEALVDITALAELRGIRRVGEHVIVGALTTHSEIEQSRELAGWAPLLAKACREVGSAQIRNRGTLGGNLGNASPAGDTLPALYALDAEVQLVCLDAERWVPVAEFFCGPGKTVRRANEVIASVRFRPSEPGERCFFAKIGQRQAVRVAKASAAATLVLAGSEVRRCRIALGALAPTVIRAPEMEAYLTGRQLTPETIEVAASLAADACRPIDDIRSTRAYRCRVTRVLVARGLRRLAERSSDEE